MLRSLSLAALLLGLCSCGARADDYPTPAHDAARSGRTTDRVSPPFRVRWAKAWQYENIATVSQLIVAEGRGFIGTLGRDNSFAGKVHCVDVRDGHELWTYEDLQGGIAHSLTWSPHAGGTVYAATTFGEVVALEAATGKLRWKFVTPLGGFVVNPCVADDAVLLGSRQGVFYALNETDGSIRWQRDVKIPICNTAAAAEGVVYFLDEGMHTYALTIDEGRNSPGWVSRQLHGGAARFYWPVIAGEHVMFTVAAPHKYNWGETDGVLFKVPGVKNRKEGDYFAIGTPEQEAAEQQNVIQFLKEKPHNQVLHCLSRTTGRASCIPGVLYTGGSGSEGTPPVLTKDGKIIVEYRSYYSQWDSDSWVNPYSALGTLNPSTGVVTQLRPQLQDKRVPWGHVWLIADESSSFTVAGDALLVSHQGNFGGVDLASGKTFAGVGNRDTWGGYPALSWNRQEWHGGPRSPLTVVDGTVYYVVGGRVIACEGNAKGGANAEVEIVPAKLDDWVFMPSEDKSPSEEDLKRIFDEVAKRQKTPTDDESTKALRAALAAHVTSFLEYANHAPYHEWRGIGESHLTFSMTADAIFPLSVALPHLEQELAERVVRYLPQPHDVQSPFRPDISAVSIHAEKRNFHKVDGAEFQSLKRDWHSLTSHADRYTWATYFASQEKLPPKGSFYTGVWLPPNGTPPDKIAGPIEHSSTQTDLPPTMYSQELTNLVGHVLMNADWRDANGVLRATRAITELEQALPLYLTQYRQIGRDCAAHTDAVPGDKQHPSAGGQFRNQGGPYVGKTHAAAILYWTDLCPEIGAVLAEYAPSETEAIRRWMLRNAQGFYLVRWDTPVQEGEVAAPLYVTTQNYFHVFGTIPGSDAATHRLLVDMPACHADPYYVERLVRAMEASGAEEK